MPIMSKPRAGSPARQAGEFGRHLLKRNVLLALDGLRNRVVGDGRMKSAIDGENLIGKPKCLQLG